MLSGTSITRVPLTAWVSAVLSSPNVVLPEIFKLVPTYKFLAIPTPPANVVLATVVLDASVTLLNATLAIDPKLVSSALFAVSILM